MSADAAQPKPVPRGPAPSRPAPRRRKWARIGGALALLLLLLALALRVALQPEHVTRIVLDQVGKALGLEITASGTGEYRVLGTPMLVVRDVVAREPGTKTAILRAERVLLSLPWSTIRSRGSNLDITRVELDAPVIDVAALQHWLDARPPGKTRIPTLSDGLHVRRGRIEAGSWHVEGIDFALPQLHPDRPLVAHIDGRYVAAPTNIRFDVAVALSKPGNGAGMAVIGALTVDGGRWTMPARIRFSGPLHIGDGRLNISPARLAMSARYQSGETKLPFAFGVTGPLHSDYATWTWAPVGMALRGSDAVPDIDARGALALGQRLVVRVAGRLPTWPDAWPTLPAPIGQSTSPLPFVIDYVGKADFSDIAALQLQRDETRFDARFRLFDVLAWTDLPAGGSPLPPLSGHLVAPRLEISGAQLEGIEVILDDDTVGRASTTQGGTQGTRR